MFPNTNYYHVEGHSLTRPPLFDGTDYNYWKERMKVFLQSTDYRLWQVIVNGPHVVEKVTPHGFSKEKAETVWNEEDIKKVQLNNQAMHILLCAIKPEEYMKLSPCNTAKEVWDKLQIVYEGKCEVRLKRMETLSHEYKHFKMREDEGIEDMFGRLSHIIYDLHAYGISFSYSNYDLIQKVLGSLSSPWRDKVDALRKDRSLCWMTYDEIRGDLITYEKYFMKKEDKKNLTAQSSSISTGSPTDSEKSHDVLYEV